MFTVSHRHDEHGYMFQRLGEWRPHFVRYSSRTRGLFICAHETLVRLMPGRIGLSILNSARSNDGAIGNLIRRYTYTVPTKLLGTPPYFQCILMALRVLEKCNNSWTAWARFFSFWPFLWQNLAKLGALCWRKCKFVEKSTNFEVENFEV